MPDRFYRGMKATEAMGQLNGLHNDVQSVKDATAAGVASASSSAAQAAAARDAALAAWGASTAPAEQLAAISRNAHIGPVADVFVYDTTKDSDGGEWRKRCRNTSWENEALVPGKYLGIQTGPDVEASARAAPGAAVGDYFQSGNSGSFYQLAAAGAPIIYRGNTREFPAVAVIVAEAARVVIYDATKPDLPMWMVIVGQANGEINSRALPHGGITRVRAVNGGIYLSISDSGSWWGGVWCLNFAGDFASRYMRWGTINVGLFRKPSPLAQRHTAEQFYKVNSTAAPINLDCRAVSVAVLPDAPSDPATGLQVPTIAVGTAAGATVIKHDGTSLNSGGTMLVDSVHITDRGTVALTYYGHTAETGPIALLGPSWGFGGVNILFGVDTGFNAASRHVANPLATMTRTTWTAAAGGNGLALLKRGNESANSMICPITVSSNSGWQPGDIRGAWLADISVDALLGAELLSNGTFDANLANWTIQGSGGSTVTWNAGTARIAPDGVNAALIAQGVPTVAGRTYRVSFDAAGAPVIVIVGTAIGNSSLYNSTAATTPVGVGNTFTFVGTGATVWISFTRTAAVVITIDNISVKAVDPDRSHKRKNLNVNGTITRAPVAAGAQLVAYSGFSSVNYLEQPYNPDLDFGTGDFAVMTWLYWPAAVAGRDFIKRTTKTGASSGDGSYFNLYTDASANPRWQIADSTGAWAGVAGANPLPAGRWCFLIGLKRAGNLELWLDGQLLGTAVAPAGQISNPAAVLMVGGTYWNNQISGSTASLALLRISASAPTANMIAQMYRDELQLFQPGAQCVIDGTTHFINDLAYDPDTDTHHTATTWGRCAFKGLRRVESEAGSLARVDATGGMIVAGSSNRNVAVFRQASVSVRDELRRRSAARRAMALQEIPFDFDPTAGTKEFTLPLGWSAKGVFVAGVKKRVGATKDYTVSFDGYQETIIFGVSPGATWVQVTANRSI